MSVENKESAVAASRECCDDHEQIDFEINPWWPRVVVGLILLTLAGIAFTPEIAGFIFVLTH